MGLYLIEELKADRKSFLSKLYELSGYNPRIPIDGFEVGRQLNFDEDKTTSIMNYLLEKKQIRKSDISIPINTGDPPPSRPFMIIFITSKGIDELDTETTQPTTSYQYGDVYHTQIGSTDKSNIQVGPSRNNVYEVIETGTITEITSIINNLKDTLKNTEMQFEKRSEIESDTHELERELSTQQPNKSKIRSTLGSLYNKMNNVAPFISIAIQLAD